MIELEPKDARRMLAIVENYLLYLQEEFAERDGVAVREYFDCLQGGWGELYEVTGAPAEVGLPLGIILGIADALQVTLDDLSEAMERAGLRSHVLLRARPPS